VDGGDELLDNVVENGMNLFNETENASGGVNSARGDMGAYNLRNMGTGNTLTLLNGRRLVNSPGYQTELIGGDYVPAMTVNSNLMAGVVNNVMQSDYEGFLFRVKQNSYDHFDANDTTISIKFGKTINGGRTNISVFADYYDRERIMASEDARWGDSDHRKWTTCDLPEGVEDMGRCLPDGNPWAGSTSFRNLSSNSLYGQFDMVSSSEHGSSNLIWSQAVNMEAVIRTTMYLPTPMVNSRSFLWAILAATIAQARVVKYLTPVTAHVSHKTAMA